MHLIKRCSFSEWKMNGLFTYMGQWTVGHITQSKSQIAYDYTTQRGPRSSLIGWVGGVDGNFSIELHCYSCFLFLPAVRSQRVKHDREAKLYFQNSTFSSCNTKQKTIKSCFQFIVLQHSTYHSFRLLTMAAVTRYSNNPSSCIPL